MEYPSTGRNVTKIIFHHGISTHFCGAPVSQQEELHHAVAPGLQSEGLWQFPSPSWGVSGRYVVLPYMPALECRLLRVGDDDPPKPSLNALAS